MDAGTIAALCDSEADGALWYGDMEKTLSSGSREHRRLNVLCGSGRGTTTTDVLGSCGTMSTPDVRQQDGE